jgi:hypothetical protein
MRINHLKKEKLSIYSMVVQLKYLQKRNQAGLTDIKINVSVLYSYFKIVQ